MGYSLSWVAVKADPKAVYSALKVQPTGQRQRGLFERPGMPALSSARRVPPLPKDLCAALLLAAQTIVIFNRKELKDRQLAAVSQIGETIYCFVEEHVMVCVVALWQDGNQVWRVTHDAQVGLDHLSVDGDVPPFFASIRDKYVAKQAAEPEDDVDRISDIPVELARELTGFRHDQEISGASAEPFEMLEPVKKKKWWSLS
jgi:hypothetical protein